MENPHSIVTLTNGESQTVKGSPPSLIRSILNPPRNLEGPVFYRFERRPDEAGDADEQALAWHVRTDYVVSIAPA